MHLFSTALVLMYVIFIAVTFLLAIIYNCRDQWIPFAYASIILAIASPLVAFLFIIGKPTKMSGFMYIFEQVLDANLIAFIIVLLHLYLLFTLGLFLKDSVGKKLSSYFYALINKIRTRKYFRNDRNKENF
ncbi:hypothetical protein A21D_02595 [Virgibacillus dokdonensis]|nr:hypothetical protein A21D_02595 [Virgibacillus dokdonensis]